MAAKFFIKPINESLRAVSKFPLVVTLVLQLQHLSADRSETKANVDFKSLLLMDGLT